MNNLLLLPAAVVALMLGALAPAWAAEPRPGIYYALGGTGELRIERAGPGLAFAIDASGPNGHMCSLEGTIRDGIGIVVEDGDACRVRLKPMDGGYDVESLTMQACRLWCGARGAFEYDYRPLPAQCSDARYKERRKAFLGFYKARRYEAALDAAVRLKNECGRFRHWLETDSLANDIAITQYHLQKPADCLATLKQLRAWEYGSVEDVENDLPPLEADAYRTTARSTLTNRGLCEAALAHARR